MASEAQPRSPLADGPAPFDAGEHEGAERQMDLCADGERSKHGLGSVSGVAQAIRKHISGKQAHEGNIPARELRARTMASTHLTRLRRSRRTQCFACTSLRTACTRTAQRVSTGGRTHGEAFGVRGLAVVTGQGIGERVRTGFAIDLTAMALPRVSTAAWK